MINSEGTILGTGFSFSIVQKMSFVHSFKKPLRSRDHGKAIIYYINPIVLFTLGSPPREPGRMSNRAEQGE